LSRSNSLYSPTPASVMATAMQARALHLRRGVIESAVYRELQRRLVEAEELAALMSCQGSRLHGVRLVGTSSFTSHEQPSESFDNHVTSGFTSSSASETNERMKNRSKDGSCDDSRGVQPLYKTPKDAAIVLQTIGSTFRTKVGDYIDASRIRDPGLPRSARGGNLPR
jgi:hypothetical protein